MSSDRSTHRRTRLFAAAVLATLVVGGVPSLAGAAPVKFDDKAQFLAQTNAMSATGAIPNLGAAGSQVTLGSVTLDSQANPSCPGCNIRVGADWTPLIPGNDIALDGGESFDIKTAAPVTALGFELVEPSDPIACGTTCVESTFSLTLKSGTTTVGSLDISPDNDTLLFVGISSTTPFDKLELRETTGTNDNEFFGQIYTSSASPVTAPPSEPPKNAVPVVTSVTPARPPAVGTAAVLTAAVAGKADSLEWDLRGDAKPEVVSAEGQTSVRFRLLPGINRVTVRAVGPAGPGPAVTTTIPGPAKPSGLLGRIATQLLKKPPVDAAGPADGLFRLRDPRICFSASTTIRAGSLDIVGSCLSPIDSLEDIPAAERGIVERLGRTLKIPLESDTINKALGLADAYIGYNSVSVNGVSIFPKDGAAIVIAPKLDAIASSDAGLRVGDLSLASKRDFILNTVAKAGGVIPLGSFARLPTSKLKALGKLSFVGDVDVKLLPGAGALPGAAQITAKLRLPEALKNGGVDAEAGVVMRATAAQGLILDNARIGPIRADVGALSVKDLQLTYTRASEVWQGQGKACIPTGYCLDMAPPNGGVKFVNGAFDFAGASLVFKPPGIQVYPSVALERIGFAFGLGPTRFIGNARLTVMKLLAIDGRIVMAFPVSGKPFILDPNEVGGGFPAHFYGARYTGATFGVNAEAFLKIPVLGELKLANAYVLYEYPGYVALGGGIGFALGPLSLGGGVNGEFNFASGRFNLGGGVHVCLDVGFDDVCAGASAVISSRGIGACIEAGIHVGAGVIYSPYEFFLWPLDGCRWSIFQEKNVRGARVSAAMQTISVEKGDPSRVIELRGSDGAPLVKVTGPDGQALDSPADGGLVQRGSLRIIRSVPYKLTAIGLQDPKPGVYRIEPLSGSPAVTMVREAADQAAAKATVRVLGTETHRALAYDIRPRAAQRVTFTEVMASGLRRTIGTVSGGGRGKLRFSPTPGRGQRRIEAQFELAGLPAETLTVARFRPPSPALSRPARLRVARAGTSLRVTWAPVPGAAHYELVTSGSSGPQRIVRPRRPGATLKGVTRSTGGRVSVRATDRLRVGPPVSARFRATSPRQNRLGPLPRCRGKNTLVCARR